jgi:hypothetical protein
VISASSSPHFTVYTEPPHGGAPVSPEIIAGNFLFNEFAYGVVSDSAGNILVTIYSPDSVWNFVNCEITSTTF